MSAAAQLTLAFQDTDDPADDGGLPVVLGHGFALDHTLWSHQHRRWRSAAAC